MGTPVMRLDRTGDVPANVEYQFHGLANNTLATVDQATSTINASFVYAPFGEVIEATDGGGAANGLAVHPRRMNDKFVDAVSGLAYYGYRYFDKLAIGWTQQDPLYEAVPDSAASMPRRANLYQFSLSNPLRYLDPDGLDPRGYWTKNNAQGPFAFAMARHSKGGIYGGGFDGIEADAPAVVEPVDCGASAPGVCNSSQSEYATFEESLAAAGIVGNENANTRVPRRPNAYVRTPTVTQNPGTRSSPGWRPAPVASAPGQATQNWRSGRSTSPSSRKMSYGITGGVYLLVNPTTGAVMRTGRTNDLQRREREHRRDPALGSLLFQIAFRTDSPAARRGLEQYVHAIHRPQLNYVAPISPRNPRGDSYMRAAQGIINGR